jgi:alanine dehydrogenase
MLRILGFSETVAALDIPPLIEALRRMFRSDAGELPPRHRHTIPLPQGTQGSLLIIPSWQAGRHLGVKLTTHFPDNAKHDKAALLGTYLLCDGRTGEALALFDGPGLTARRIAAAAALAASYLARPDCERLLMIGTGALASHLIEAHASVRPIRNVLVWDRDPDKAQRLAHRLDRRSLKVAATADLPGAVRGAHVICCAAAAEAEPVLKGHWLPLGVHIDLIGSLEAARAVDDETIRRARIFVDARAAALGEEGEIADAIAAGALQEDDIAGDLFELTRGSRAGRRYHDQITLFNSVGHALADLATAQMALDAMLN